MKNKVKLILAFISAICVCGIITFFANNNIVDGIMDANTKYKNAEADLESQNSDIWQKKLDEQKANETDLNNRLETATAKAEELDTRIKEISAERQQAEAENPTEELTSDVMYTKLVNVGLETGVDVDKYYSYDNDKYTFTLSGKLGEIDNSIEKINEVLAGYTVDYGNISLRQNYNAYDLERTYDSGTLLDWYDNKIINALGETIEINDLLTESDETEDGIIYTVATLNDVKYDNEGYNMEVLTSNSSYESKINSLTKNYADQLAIIEKSEYSDEVKAELRSTAENQYNIDIEALKNQKQAAADAIKAKYDEKYENDKKAVSHAIKTYQDKVDQLKKMLADSSSLEYTIDLTIRCR